MGFYTMFRGWEDVQEYPAKTVIFSERDAADLMYFIISGEIELTLHGEPVGAEKEGGVIGELAMIDSATYSVTATALTEVKLARMDRDQIEVFINENAEFALHVMAVMANRLRAVDQFISKQFAKSE